MGIKWKDVWSYLHFIFGFISTLAFTPSKPVTSVIATNLIHLAMEVTEYKFAPNGKVLETNINKLFDTIAFFLGSILSVPFMPLIQNCDWLRIVLLLISLIGLIQELGREVFPRIWPIDKAFNYY